MVDYNSSEYYHILEIPGKGFGAIAKKDIKIGTLILKEKPQIFDNGSQIRLNLKENEWLEKDITKFPDWIKSVVASYNQMRKIDQEEFLKLNNKIGKHDLSTNKGYEKIHETLQTVIGQTFQGAEYDQAKILSIAEIFCSNSWCGKRGIRPSVSYIEIHSSKFNHSCNPNSRVFTECEYFLVRAICDIKAGEEITNVCNGEYLIMKRREERQKFIRDQMNFICICELCLVEDTPKDVEIYDGFQQLKKDAKYLLHSCDVNIVVGLSISKDISKAVTCYKKMYIIAQKKNVSLDYLYREIILGGLVASMKGCENVNSQRDKEKFKKDFKKFSEDAKLIDDLLGATTEERWAWQSFQEPFERFLNNNNM